MYIESGKAHLPTSSADQPKTSILFLYAAEMWRRKLPLRWPQKHSRWRRNFRLETSRRRAFLPVLGFSHGIGIFRSRRA